MKYLLLLDFDGTLTPIVSHPDLVKLTKKRQKLLEELNKEHKIAIVTGRSLSKIKKLVKIPGLTYIGNHGFEISFQGKTIIHPQAEKALPLIKKIYTQLKKALRPIKGTLVENKKYTLSIHSRKVAAKEEIKVRQIFSRIIKPYKNKVRVTQGKKVFEVRPPFIWHKGTAVLWLLKRLKGQYLPIYIGDDVTDEDAFKALKGKGITIHVGNNKRTAAKYQVKNVAGVYKFLSFLKKQDH